MKHFYIIFIIVISVFNGYTQTFSAVELNAMTKMNIDDFDTYVLKKNFKFLEYKDEPNRTGSTYAYKQSYYGKTATKFISLYQGYFGETNINITYQTADSSEYLKIKNGIKLLGFKFKNTNVSDDSTALIYQKGKYEIWLSSFQSTTTNGTIISDYEISITLKNE